MFPSALQWQRLHWSNEMQAGAEGPPFCRTWKGKGSLPSQTGGTYTHEQAPMCIFLAATSRGPLRHEDRGGLPLASCTLIITKQLCLRSPGAQSYWWWSSLKSSGWLWAFKTLCVERILYGSITSYPTLSSSVHTAPAARSLPSVGVPWPLRFLGGSPVPGTLVCGCWTVPARALTLLPSLCSSSTGHSKKPFLPAEHGSPLWRSARCPATVLLILVFTYRLAIQLHCWIFCVLGLYFRTPQRWFWRNIWSWI